MRSMTGYGRATLERDGREVTVEIKTVNHRFLDIAFRMSRSVSFCEDAMKKLIGGELSRGHADVFVTYKNSRRDARELSVDEALIKAYRRAAERISDIAGCQDNMKAVDYITLPDVVNITEAEEDREAVTALLGDALMLALGEVNSMRLSEGERMKNDLLLHLSAIENMAKKVEEKAPDVAKIHLERMKERIAEIGAPIPDEDRLLSEMAIYADHCAVDEELARLCSHIAAFREMSESSLAQGKKLDFLVQELNREVNTIGSKASDAGITSLVVEMKSEIEKIREQVQNIE
ncbi:MAG: YicC family protein [Eubacteriales bacterium]|nr:YicC family protein [Eubacteriales bacterium]MDD3880835.1 YicC family protein [Eubacteriales bacterium]MDD4511798.1 YicC family protein [Eubacteriales bacterium]